MIPLSSRSLHARGLLDPALLEGSDHSTLLQTPTLGVIRVSQLCLPADLDCFSYFAFGCFFSISDGRNVSQVDFVPSHIILV